MKGMIRGNHLGNGDQDNHLPRRCVEEILLRFLVNLPREGFND